MVGVTNSVSNVFLNQHQLHARAALLQTYLVQAISDDTGQVEAD